jgi:hypothetical protein
MAKIEVRMIVYSTSALWLNEWTKSKHRAALAARHAGFQNDRPP